MRTFDPLLAAELLKEQASDFWAVKIELVSSTYLLTSCDISIPIAGELFLSRKMKVGNLQRTTGFTVDKVSISLDDSDSSFAAIFLGENVKGRNVTLYYGCLDSNHLVIATAIMFQGFISVYDLGEDTLNFTIVNEFIFWKKRSARVCQPTCPWTFKGTADCHYAGDSTWCDQSYERCVDLSNTQHFGGFRFLPRLMEMTIWWGRIPK